MLKKFFILIVILLLPLTLQFSQTPSYSHYTSSDGLASSTVFDIIQDKDGFIWFGTLNGLSRFDGKHFTNFNTNDGLNSNVATCLAKGSNGEIYIGNYEKGINIFRNGVIKNYLRKIAGRNFNTTYLLKLSDKLYAYAPFGIINTIVDTTEFLKKNFSIKMPVSVALFKMAKLPNDSVVVLTLKGMYKITGREVIKKNIAGLPDADFYSLAVRKGGDYFIGSRGSLYQIKNDTVIKKFNLDIYRNNRFSEIMCSSKNDIWFSVLGKGFFVIPNGLDEIVNLGSKMGLENTQITKFFEDNEGNIWISTFGKGVYCLNNLYLRNYTEKDGLLNNNIICIEKDKSGRILLGTITGINILSNGVIEQLRDKTGRALPAYVNNIRCFDNKIYVCWAPETQLKKVNYYKGVRIYFMTIPSFFKIRDDLYVYGNIGNDLRITKEFRTTFQGTAIIPVFGDSLFQNRLNVIEGDTKNNIWVGSSLGLCKITGLENDSGNGLKKTFFPNDPVLNSKINSIYCDNKNRVWFTGVNGVAYYNLDNDSVSSFTNIAGYNLSTPTSVTVDNKNRTWIGTMKGLYLLENNSVKFLNSQTGLPSDEVLSLLFDNEKNILYIGTSNGLSLLDLNEFDNYFHPSLNVMINRIQAGDSVFVNYNNLIFEPDQNNVYINYFVINYSFPNAITYKYTLNGETRETKSDYLDFSSLRKGNYTLQITAGTQNTGWGKPLNLTFKILPKFVETVWFNILVILFVVTAAILIFKWRFLINKKKNREQIELTERINELKHQALSALMNPHFIFNSLNSVQYLVNDNRLEEANDYIAMMAKLMRKNLDTAGNGFILLSEEISRLSLYLDLEKLRFQERFLYEIITGSNVDQSSLLIPNMIIQPFVENSLWHGILNSGRNGKLNISFMFEEIDIDSVINTALIIKITDNGIGIKEASKGKSEDHISKGILIIEERLKLLSEKLQLPKPVMFEDLSNRGTNSKGTEVIISLPSPLYKIINSKIDHTTSSSLTD